MLRLIGLLIWSIWIFILVREIIDIRHRLELLEREMTNKKEKSDDDRKI